MITSSRTRQSANQAVSGGGNQPGAESWQETKSQLTREAILEATIMCFISQGYANTTTPGIAAMAKISRGAMTHHFKSRKDVIYSAIAYLYRKRISEYQSLMSEAISKRKPSDTSIEAIREDMNNVVRALWKYYTLPCYYAHLELITASRTDLELAQVLVSLNQDAEKVVPQFFRAMFPHWSSSEENITLTFDLLISTLRGMSVSYMNIRKTSRIENMLNHLVEICLDINAVQLLSANNR